VVWIVNQYAGSPRHGMEYRHYYLAQGLADRSHYPIVISGSRSHLFTRPPDVSRAFTLETVADVRYCWVAVPGYQRAISVGRVLNMVAFAAALERLPTTKLPRPDAILVSSPSLFPIGVAARWARRFGARLVFEVRDIWPLTLQELGGLSSRHPLADRHMVVRGMDAAKFHYLPNGVDLDSSSPSTDVPGAVHEAMQPGAFTVGFVGTLGAANVLETLIDAARLLDPGRFAVVIVGHGPERERLMARAADVPNVVFTGPVPKERITAAISLFDACYVGYRRSSLYRFGVSPNKLYEYMAAGRPVLFAAEAANQPVRDADCGQTLPPEDPRALANAIRILAARPAAERARLGANARAYVERHHAYGRLSGELAEILLGDGP
jgi:glycosyltransferase involved in cell wall biosynthesis